MAIHVDHIQPVILFKLEMPTSGMHNLIRKAFLVDGVRMLHTNLPDPEMKSPPRHSGIIFATQAVDFTNFVITRSTRPEPQ